MHYSTYLPLVFIFTVLWEHIGKKFTQTFIPSVGLTWLTLTSQNLFKLLGIWTAKISSLLTYVDLGELWTSVCDVIRPLVNLSVSATYFFEGYWQTAYEYSRPFLIPFGTVITIIIMYKLIKKFKIDSWIANTRLYFWLSGKFSSCFKFVIEFFNH
jgi:hypothetical protein